MTLTLIIVILQWNSRVRLFLYCRISLIQKISEKLIGRKNSEETKRKKSLNSAKAKLITIDGEIGSIRFWALKIGMSHTTLNYRLKTHGEDNLIQFIKSKLK